MTQSDPALSWWYSWCGCRSSTIKTLRRLEEDGFVKRTLYPEVPPRVEYELTDLGRSFLAPLKNLIAWANENHRAICEARDAYGVKNDGR